MILKKIYEEYGFNIENLLIKESKRLKLSTNELNVLLVFFSIPAKKRIFSFNSIARKVDYSTNELAEIIESLMNKDFLKISLETHNKKEREVFDLDGTYTLIENLFNMDEEEKTKEKVMSNIGETISLLEEKFNRMLRSNELERIRTWYESFDYQHNNIVSIVSKLEKETSLIYIEKMLNLNISEIEEIDPKTNKLLDNIFNKL